MTSVEDDDGHALFFPLRKEEEEGEKKKRRKLYFRCGVFQPKNIYFTCYMRVTDVWLLEVAHRLPVVLVCLRLF